MNEPLEAAAVDCVHKVQGKEDQGNEAHYILGALSSVSKARPWKEGTPLKEAITVCRVMPDAISEPSLFTSDQFGAAKLLEEHQLSSHGLNTLCYEFFGNSQNTFKHRGKSLNLP
ncbi:unnamed protein product [Clonostachys rosea f. rosea IK726]|uniref:Uncharacterized protein n=1 Tax=Clonostachys rosea f. rosea IK726 TaxID=1349383 RepID=A0ACA9T8H1_BIOOC|nr:unnamed protein product [Clonostachys rosea f. rosea IK726]